MCHTKRYVCPRTPYTKAYSQQRYSSSYIIHARKSRGGSLAIGHRKTRWIIGLIKNLSKTCSYNDGKTVKLSDSYVYGVRVRYFYNGKQSLMHNFYRTTQFLSKNYLRLTCNNDRTRYILWQFATKNQALVLVLNFTFTKYKKNKTSKS